MRNSFESSGLDTTKGVESLGEKEKIWSDTFGSEYKPDFDYKDFFCYIKSHDYDAGYGLLNHEVQDDIEKFAKLFPIVEKNGFRVDIKFLESLDDKLKIYISQIFLKVFSYNPDRKYLMGGSLFIWMIHWGMAKGGIYYVGDDVLKQVAKNIEGFNLKYFRQAYDFMTRIEDKNIYNIINEYNLLVNIDKDVKSLEISETSLLGENFSIGVLHARSETAGYGYTEKYGLYELDCNGNEKRFRSIGDQMEYNGLGNITILDRDHESIHEDASGKEYNVYIDSPAGLALFYQGMPIACISFYIKEGKEIFINQIQKIAYYEYDRYGRTIGRHYPSVLDSIDRKEYIYNVVISLAKKYNISQITIQGAKNNRWIKEPREDTETDYFANYVKPFLDKSWEKKHDKKFHLRKEFARKIYDVFAKKQGFQKDKDGNREKEI